MKGFRYMTVANNHLALSDDILMKIEKPARYIGNEVNSVIKDKEKDII